MPVRTGGDLPDPINTETEYAGKVPMPNTVGDRGPEERDLEPHERKRLGLLTGQDEDVYAARKSGFMGGIDRDYPEHPELHENIPDDYSSEDYLS